ncbi:MAG: DinB family protein [Anaerolineae bacterium]
MNAQQALLELLAENDYYLRRFLTDVEEECLHWHADDQSNSIAILIWHVCRVQDVFYTQHILGQEGDNEIWFRDSYHTRTGYDPRGIGVNGWGMLSNYTPAEMRAIPRFPAETLLAYYDTMFHIIEAYLRKTNTQTLFAPAVGYEGQQTNWFWIRHPLFDMTRHIGEMLALEGLWQRAQG